MNNLPTEPILINSITPEKTLAKGANPELIDDILTINKRRNPFVPIHYRKSDIKPYLNKEQSTNSNQKEN